MRFTTRELLSYSRMYLIRSIFSSATEMNTPRAITPRAIFANHSSTWFNHDQVGRRQVQLHRRMVAEDLLHSLRLVRRHVVGDHVNLLACRLMYHDLTQKRTAGIVYNGDVARVVFSRHSDGVSGYR